MRPTIFARATERKQLVQSLPSICTEQKNSTMEKWQRERDKSKWNSFQEGPQVHAWHEHDLFSSTNRQVFGIGWWYQKGEMCIKICSHINILLCMRRNTFPLFGSTNWISPSLQTETWAYFFYTKNPPAKCRLWYCTHKQWWFCAPTMCVPRWSASACGCCCWAACVAAGAASCGVTDGVKWLRVSAGARAGAPAAEGSLSGSSPDPHLTPHAWAWAAQPACPAVPSCNPFRSLPVAVNPVHRLPARANGGAGQLCNSVSQPPLQQFDAKKREEKQDGEKNRNERGLGGRAE